MKTCYVILERSLITLSFRQIGGAGLGPAVFFLETNKSSHYWGLVIMEYLPDGGFDEEFNNYNVNKDDMAEIGSLLGQLHTLPTTEVVQAASLARNLVLEQDMEQKLVEELYTSRGGFPFFLILWWKKWLPDWMAKYAPQNHPLPQSNVDRFLNLIVKVSRMKTLTAELSKLGFSHMDIWHGNLMRKREKIVAIDCETATVAPAFLDFGGILWNSKSLNHGQPYLNRIFREALVLSFYQSIGKNCHQIRDALYDLELAFIHRQLFCILCVHFDLVTKPLSVVEDIGRLLMEKTEMMVSGMEKALEDENTMKDVLEKGIYWAIRDELPDGHEENIKKCVSTFEIVDTNLS